MSKKNGEIKLKGELILSDKKLWHGFGIRSKDEKEDKFVVHGFLTEDGKYIEIEGCNNCELVYIDEEDMPEDKK